MATNLDFTIVQGEDQDLFTTQYLDEEGVAINLTDCSFKMAAKDSIVSSPFLDFDSTVDVSNMVITGSSLTVKLTSVQSKAIEVSGGFYDLWIIDSLGQKFKLLYGDITVDRSVTDA